MFPKTAAVACIFILFITSLWILDAKAGILVIKPSLRVEESYDNNAYGLSSGNEEGALVTTVAPQIEFINEYKELRISGNYSLASRYNYYNSDRNYMTHNSGLGITWNRGMTRNTSLSLSDFASTSYSTTDSFQVTDIGIQIRRSGVFSNTATVTLSHMMSQLNSVSVTASDSFLKYDDSSSIDTRTDSASINFTRQFMSLMSANASYTYTNFHFERSMRDDTQTHSFQLGVSKQFPLYLILNLSGGAVYSGEISDKYDWTSQVSLSKRFEMSSIGLAYSRGVTTSSGLTDEININDRGTLTWSRPFTRTMNMVLSGAYSQNHTEPTSALQSTSYDTSISADWRPEPWISIGVSYSHFQQWFDGPSGSGFMKNQVLMSVTASPEGWRF